MADILTPELFNELDNLVRALQIKFNQPEFIAGCQVLSITDINEYATNNGWIEALCGHHNRQRVRWKSAEVIAINDYIDVIYFPDRRLFEAWGIGGSTAPAASAHAMLSASHSDSLAGTVSAGDIIIGNNTPAWARLARGTNGQVLTLASGLPSWADSTGGGWPFANILTVSTTDADADYSTLTAAITAASAGDAIRLDAGTLTESVTVDKNIFIIGYGAVLTSSSATTLTLSSRCRIIGLEVLNTASGASARCVQVSSGVAPPVLEYCRLLKISGTPTIGAALYISGSAGVELRECQINGSSGTSGYGIYADVLTSVIMRGGYLSGPTLAAYSTDAASTLILQNLPDITGPIAFGNVSGDSAGFYTTVGNMYALRNTGIIGGVWLHYANGLRSWFPTLPDASSVAVSGDIIEVCAGTYDLGSSGLIINEPITLIGYDAERTIITSSVSNDATIKITTNGVTLRGLRITHTGGGTTAGAVATNSSTTLLEDCTIDKVSGTPTTAYGVNLYGAGSVRLTNCRVTVETGTTKRGVMNITAAGNITVEGGEINGTTTDLYSDQSGAFITLRNTILTNGSIDWAGILDQTPEHKITKNLLIDSLCYNIWQSGTTFNDFTDDSYGPTLWNMLHNGQAPDASGQAGASTDPFAYYFRCTFDSASSQAGIVQFIEAQDTYPLRGRIVSLSFDAWGTNVTELRAAVLSWGSTADALTSDVVGTWATDNPTLATNWSYANTPASDITISSTRRRYAINNITIPTTANNLAVFIWTSALQDNTDLFNIARVQLERGIVATDFVTRGINEELTQLQRLYNKSYSTNTSPGTATVVGVCELITREAVPASTSGSLRTNLRFPLTMRTVPTVTLYDFSAGTINAVTNASASTIRSGCTAESATLNDSGMPAITVDNSDGDAIALDALIAYHYTADARL